MSHGVNKKTPPSPFPHLPSPTRFSADLFVVLQEILYQPSFVLIRLLWKIMHFQSKTTFFFQIIVCQVWFCCFDYKCFTRRFFTVLLSWNCESIISCFRGFLFGLSSIMWHNDRIPALKIRNLLFFGFRGN